MFKLNINKKVVRDPEFIENLFSSTWAAWFWLVVRLYVGWQWITAGWHKVTDPAWVQTGEALKGYWERAVAIPETGRPAITFGWYRSFLSGLLESGSYTWFAKLIAYGVCQVDCLRRIVSGYRLDIGYFHWFCRFLRCVYELQLHVGRFC